MNANDFVILNHEKFLSDFFLVLNVNMHKVYIYLLRDGKYILVIVKWKKNIFQMCIVLHFICIPDCVIFCLLHSILAF